MSSIKGKQGWQRKVWEPKDCGAYYEIPLSQGLCAKIDKEDYNIIKDLSWFAVRGHSGPYAISRCGDKKIKMHRLLLGIEGNMQVDHINHDTLDNRRCNIRACLNKDNARNRIKQRNNTSGYVGITRYNNTDKWCARIRINRVEVYKQVFDDIEEAHRCREAKAKELFGEYYCECKH